MPDRMEAQAAIDELIAYCARYAQGFADALLGATDAEIADLATLARQPLAPEHAAFLARFGRTPPGSLDPFLDKTEFGVAAAEQFYADPPVPVPDDAVYLWTLDFDLEMFLPVAAAARPVLLFHWPVDPETGRSLPQDRTATTIADLLLQYLYKEAFLRLRRPALAYHAELRPADRLDPPDPGVGAQRQRDFRQIAERLGFAKVPYMDGALAFYDRDDAALALYPDQRGPGTIYADADSELELLRVCEILSDNLGLARWT